MKRYFISYELHRSEVLTSENFPLHLLKKLMDIDCSAITSYHEGCVMFSSEHDFDHIRNFVSNEEFIKHIYFTMGEISPAPQNGDFNSTCRSNTKHTEKIGLLINDIQKL